MSKYDENFRSDCSYGGDTLASDEARDAAPAKLAYTGPRLRLLSRDDLDGMIPTPIFTVKYLYTNDVSSCEREAFVEKALPGATIAKYRLIYDILPRTDEPASIVIVSGNDNNRLASFMKNNLPILRRVPTLAFGSSLSPRRRAELLRLGYDDVLNMDSLTGPEFAAKVAAIYNRHRLTRQVEQELSEFQQEIRKICNYDELSGAQRRIIEVLVRARGSVCSYGALQNALAGEYYEASLSNLRVVIHNVKRHLRSGTQIENIRSEGYRLITRPAGPPAPSAPERDVSPP